jgi:hypothetical protein
MNDLDDKSLAPLRATLKIMATWGYIISIPSVLWLAVVLVKVPK